jgi:FixJ family two-component response regulator
MPIIFVTAFSEETIRARVLTNGALGYLSKPLQEQSLIECLEQALKRPVKISPEKRSPALPRTASRLFLRIGYLSFSRVEQLILTS